LIGQQPLFRWYFKQKIYYLLIFIIF
jgi:hypothetical protein